MAKITYADKVNTVTTATPDINKIRDVDLNEIKTVVNGLDDGTTTLINDVSALQTDVGNLQADVIAVDADVNTLNSNVNALKNKTGWANYADTGNSFAIDDTATKITIDSATVIDQYLPLEIRGTGKLWDEVNNKIKPISVGDAYEIRFNFTVAGKSNPNRVDVMLDIGGGATPTNVISSIAVTLEKTVPFDKYITIPIFSLDTFIANGGQIFMATDVGSINIAARSIFINRTHSEL